MATVNLGRIKPVFRGAYNNSTPYVIDDIVTSGNETFIAIAATQGNATTDASKWTKLAAKGADGADGTDVGATLANKEIAFKTNAGALDGIPIGSAGEFLKVNSGATGYEFGAVGGGVSNAFFAYDKANQTSGDVTFTTELFDDGGNYNHSNGRYTAPSAGKYIFICNLYMGVSGSNDMYYKKNGSTFAGGSDWGAYGNSTAFVSSLNCILDLSANDYISLYTSNNTYSNYCYFGGAKLY